MIFRATKRKATYLLMTVALVMVFCAGLSAQSYIGAYVSINNGKLSGDSPPGFIYQGKLLPGGGLAFDIKFKHDVFLTVSPSYVIGGSRMLYPGRDENGDKIYKDSIDLKFQFLTLPVLLKIISDNGKFEFLGGPKLVFPLSAMADNGAEAWDIYHELKSVSLNLSFGVGYRIPIAKNILAIDFIYSQGLTNIANNFEDINAKFKRIRVTSARLSATWYLPVGKSKKMPQNP